MKLAIRKHAGHFAAIVGLALIAALVGGYILHNQRLRFPWEGKPFQLQAAFSTAQAVTPGQGQTVRVSGVRVGDISKVEPEGRPRGGHDGARPEVQGPRPHRRARAAAPQDRAEGHVHRARPGHRPRAAGQARAGTLPVSNTLPDVNPDEILASLDSDTRDYLTLLVDGAGRRPERPRQRPARGLPPLRAHAPRPRAASTAWSPSATATSAGSCTRWATSTTSSPARATTSPRSSTPPRRSSAPSPPSRPNITRAVGDLPGALRQTTDTLGKRADASPRALRPGRPHLQPALQRAQPRQRRGAARSPRRRRRSSATRSARSCATRARSCARPRSRPTELAGATPDLTSSFTVLNHLFNLLGYNPDGREGPGNGRPRRRATCSGSRGCSTTAPRCSRPPTPTGRSARSTLGGTCGDRSSQLAGENPPLDQTLAARADRPEDLRTN